MTKNEAQQLIKYVFTHKFDEQYFGKFISNLFKEYTPLSKTYEGHYIKHAFKPQVAKYKVMGSFSDSEGSDVDILLVALNNINTLQRSRTLQRNFVADYLNTNNKEAAIVAFVTDKDEWRFSLVKLDHTLEVIEEKLRTKKDITPARRWSFLVGKNEGSHTAQSRFINLLTHDEKPNLPELESAFNIESVTKEFFERYTELFFNLQEHLDQLIKDDEVIRKDFEDKEISTADFAKKTLGQIVFLYFLQKKGWFGVASDKEWGSGPKNFLREVFNRRDKYGKNFFNDILEPLFYEGLAQDRGEKAIYTRLNNVRMPFLNGGLFEPMNNYQWETTNIIIPDKLFSNDTKNEKTGDTGTGILDIFDRYNFTVNENEPLEQEVAVDPEMLGKVFENLLEIKDRKSKGAFYTPREIVHYMCQETLINYLETETDNIDRSDIEYFIRKGEQILENDKITSNKRKEKEEKGYEYKGDYSYLLPSSIIDNAKRIDKLLYEIKVADPAVGSGAFPLGMLNEIVRARRVIGVHTKDNKKVSTLKKETISNSLHCVDIDPGAVEIAKLRLWLSLVVDENKPEPLPNLDHKIMQGNSLISEYEGIKLFDEKLLEDTDELTQQSLSFEKNDLEHKIESLRSKTDQYINESQRTVKSNLKKEIDELKWDLIDITMKQEGREDKIEEIKKLRRKNIKPFFVWKLEFADVFKEKGGFDVVIGNPPYVRQEKFKDIKPALKDIYGDFYNGRSDLYTYFIKLGSDLIRKRASICLIISNKFLVRGYGENSRKFLSQNMHMKKMINFGELPVFQASVDSIIISAQKSLPSVESTVSFVQVKNASEINQLNKFFNENQETIPISYLGNEEWSLQSIDLLSLVNKIKSHKSTLEKYFNQKSFAGIKTGCDDAFVINSEIKNLLISEHPQCARLIKPWLRGKDVKKWKVDSKDLFLIYIPLNSIDINEFPSIKSHLLKYKSLLESRATNIKWFELQQPQENFTNLFNGKKIIYPDCAKEMRAALDDTGSYGTMAMYFLPYDPLILGILNSSLFDWYARMSFATFGDPWKGGRLIFKTIYLSKFPIPQTKNDIAVEINSKVDLILKQKDQMERKKIENKIDELVMDLYELTEEEKEIIRNS